MLALFKRISQSLPNYIFTRCGLLAVQIRFKCGVEFFMTAHNYVMKFYTLDKRRLSEKS